MHKDSREMLNDVSTLTTKSDEGLGIRRGTADLTIDIDRGGISLDSTRSLENAHKI